MVTAQYNPFQEDAMPLRRLKRTSLPNMTKFRHIVIYYCEAQQLLYPLLWLRI